MGEEDEQKASAKAGKRLRLSVVDFNASFADKQDTKGGVDSALLDVFKSARIDDYTLVNTVFFAGEDASHNAKPPAFFGFGPLGKSSPKDNPFKVHYLDALITGMHKRDRQVIVGYTLDEGASPSTPDGLAFNAWLGAASTAQVTAHASQIVEFFVTTNSLAIDGINFDFEIHGLGNQTAHTANMKTLILETAKALVAKRPDASVSYDNTPFVTNDGKDALSWFMVQPYSIAAGTTNVIARPMHNLKTHADPKVCKQTIDLAMKKGGGGGGIAPANLQIMTRYSAVDTPLLVDLCTKVLMPEQVGLVLYNMGTNSADTSSLKSFADNVKLIDAALNPAAAAPGKAGAPVQAPLSKAPSAP